MDPKVVNMYRIKKYSKIFALFLLFLLVTLFIVEYIRIKPNNVRFTNISATAVTVSWNTKSPTPGYAFISTKKGILPISLFTLGKHIGYDTRDIKQAELEATAKTAENIYENESGVISINDIETEVKINEAGKYYTHHVELKNLNPETEYSISVGDGLMFNMVKDVKGQTIIATLEPLDTVLTPVPAYGSVKDAQNQDLPLEDLLPVTDAVLYFTLFDNETGVKSSTASSSMNSDGNWYVDVSSIINTGTENFLELYNDVQFEIKLDAGPKGDWEAKYDVDNIAPAPLVVINMPNSVNDSEIPGAVIKSGLLTPFESKAYAQEDDCSFVHYCGPCVDSARNECSCPSDVLERRSSCIGDTNEEETAKEAAKSYTDKQKCGDTPVGDHSPIINGKCKYCVMKNVANTSSYDDQAQPVAMWGELQDCEAPETAAEYQERILQASADHCNNKSATLSCADFEWNTKTNRCDCKTPVSTETTLTAESPYAPSPSTNQSQTESKNCTDNGGEPVFNYWGDYVDCEYLPLASDSDSCEKEGDIWVPNNLSSSSGQCISESKLCGPNYRYNQETKACDELPSGNENTCEEEFMNDKYAVDSNLDSKICFGGQWFLAPSLNTKAQNCLDFVRSGGMKAKECPDRDDSCINMSTNTTYRCSYNEDTGKNEWSLNSKEKEEENQVKVSESKELGDRIPCENPPCKCENTGRVLYNKGDYCPETSIICNEHSIGKICNTNGNTCESGYKTTATTKSVVWDCTGPIPSPSSFLKPFIDLRVAKSYAQSMTTFLIDTQTGIISNVEAGVYSFEINNIKYLFEITNNNIINDNILLFIDTNENGTYDEGVDTKVSDLASQITIKAEILKYQYSLSQGLNFVSLPFLASEDIERTASGLLQSLNEKYDDNIFSISKYDGTWKVVGQNIEVYDNNDFQLLPGQGYIIKTKKDLEIEIWGQPIQFETEEDSAAVTLFEGWNLIGLYGNNIKEYTAKSLIQDINAYEPVDLTANNVTKWDSEVQRYEGLQLDIENGVEMEYGFDYALNTLEGYFVRISEGTGNWQPSVK